MMIVTEIMVIHVLSKIIIRYLVFVDDIQDDVVNLEDKKVYKIYLLL